MCHPAGYRPQCDAFASCGYLPSDGQVTDEGGGQLRPAERRQAPSHEGKELAAPGLAEGVGTGLRGEVGQVILGAIANLEGVAQAGHLLEEASGLRREVRGGDLVRRWRRVALESNRPVVGLHVRPEAS